MEFDTIESDPGVFTEMIEQIGCDSVQLEEIYDLARFPRDALGLIFLFRYQSTSASSGPEIIRNFDPSLFFAKQIYNNACATQAILNILLNCEGKVDLGRHLTDFKAFTRDFDSSMKGAAIMNDDVIRKAHNSFGRQNSFEMESSPAGDDDDVFHFIAYVPHNGTLFELDGLQEGPIAHGECSDGTWVERVIPVIQARTASYAATETRFALMAVVRNVQKQLRSSLASLLGQREFHTALAASIELPIPPLPVLPLAPGDVPPAEPPAEMDGLEVTQEALMKRLQEVDGEIMSVAEQLSQEIHRRQEWRDENLRRRHNYVPFIVELLKQLASHGELAGLVQQGCRVAVEKAEKEAQREKVKKEATEKEKQNEPIQKE